MQFKTHFLVALAAVMVAPVILTACGGPECGTGTTEEDGSCVPTAATVTCDDDTELSDGKCVSTVEEVTCAAGTDLADGECVLAADGCGEGTSLSGGECVADDPDLSGACGDGTSFDSAAGACVADSTVTCGANTVEEDGSCVPDTSAVCATGTLPDADGLCVVAAAACGGNTILDPDTNTCVVNDTGVYCGANTAFDTDTDTCVPTGDVCDAGTTFDDVTGLCLPDASCEAGDVILNGVCVSPAREAFANADVTVDETSDRLANNDDANLGGMATDLTVAMMGTEYRAAGQINTPVDVDGDGEVDQDIDSYTFTGTAGQLFKVAAQPVSGPAIAFIIRNDDGSFERLSTAGLTPGAAREVLLPADGTYTIDVTSAIAITGPAAPVGDDAWDYVLSLEELPAPTITAVDTSTDSIMGDFANLSDNLFQLTNLTVGENVAFSADIGRDVGVGFMQVWSSPTELVDTYPIADGETVSFTVATPDTYVFFDWGFVFGPETQFDVDVQALTLEIEPNDDLASAQQLALPFVAVGTGGYANGGTPTEWSGADAPFDFYTFDLAQDLAANEVLSLSLESIAAVEPSTGPYLILHDSTGMPLLTADTSNIVERIQATGLLAGTYYLTVSVSFGTGFDTAYRLSGRIAPIPTEDIGSVASGTSLTSTPQTLSSGDLAVTTFTLAAGDIAEISYTNDEDEDADISITGPDLVDIDDDSFEPSGATTPEYAYVYSPNGGTYTIALGANEDVTNSTLTITAITPPDAGSFDAGDSIQSTDTTLLERNRSRFVKITLANDVSASGSLLGGGGETTGDFSIIDAVTGVVLVDETSGTDMLDFARLPAGDHIVEIEATTAELPTGYVLDLALTTPPLAEVEPNDDLASAQLLALPFDVTGTGGYAANNDREFTAADVPFDFYTFDLAQDLAANEALTIMLENTATSSASSAPYVTLHDSTGAPIVSADIGDTLEVPNLLTGTYYVTVSVDTVTSSDTAYRLRGSITPFVAPIAEVEPNDDLASAQQLTFPGKVIGTGGYAGGGTPAEWSALDTPFDFYTFDLAQGLAAGEVLRITLDSIAAVQPSASPYVTLHDSTGAVLLTSGTSGTSKTITATGLTAGMYFVTVSADFNTSFDTEYELFVRLD